MVFGFSFNWTPILPGDPNVTTGIYEFNLIGKELKIIISEEFLMLTNEASYSIRIPTISACFSEETQATQLLLPKLWVYLFLWRQIFRTNFVLPTWHFFFYPCIHSSITVSCVKVITASICSSSLLLTSLKELNCYSSHHGTEITHGWSSEMGPAQFLLDLYSLRHLSYLVDIKLCIQNKWHF